MADWYANTAVFPCHWLWEKNPVFHLRARIRGGDDPAFWIDKTRCGIVLYKHRRGTDQTLVDRSFSMRREHAEKFARPCRRCVPQ